MAQLRAPDGCPWDREQTIDSLRPYLIEETYEVLDAIERRDWDNLVDELGDLQLQIVFQARIAQDEGIFEIADVLEAISKKLIRRHPHVFESESIETATGVERRWDEIKAEEKGDRPSPESMLDDISRSQPALIEASEIGKRAAKTGFDWEKLEDLFDKLREEVDELRHEAQADTPHDTERLEDEVGDLLFMAVNIARYLKVHPELALRRANRKFRKRFGYIERELRAKGRSPEASSLEEMEALWQDAKAESMSRERE